ncbi:MAG TPA: ferritin-like domain-containing protein [Candidatus Cybelea sp.]|nr:ferritin-like domain-containing protein [Candidatus Cybelea sp.]
MAMGRHWTLDDIPWDRFDPAKVDPELLRAVKAAALVEQNSGDYVTYLCNVFHDDAEFQAAAHAWGEEEVQHGQALGRWAVLADPAWDFDAAYRRFTANFRLPLEATHSVRGSRTGELIARCVVEVGTSSFYSAIRDAAEEPVLKIVCARIAGDEFRHYKLFYDQMRRFETTEPLGLGARLMVALSRLNEAEDDELASAYYAANCPNEPYDRARHAAAYSMRAMPLYRFGHVQRGIGMVLKACDLNPQGRLSHYAARLAWSLMRRKIAKAERLAA